MLRSDGLRVTVSPLASLVQHLHLGNGVLVLRDQLTHHTLLLTHPHLAHRADLALIHRQQRQRDAIRVAPRRLEQIPRERNLVATPHSPPLPIHRENARVALYRLDRAVDSTRRLQTCLQLLDRAVAHEALSLRDRQDHHYTQHHAVRLRAPDAPNRIACAATSDSLIFS